MVTIKDVLPVERHSGIGDNHIVNLSGTIAHSIWPQGFDKGPCSTGSYRGFGSFPRNGTCSCQLYLNFDATSTESVINLKEHYGRRGRLMIRGRSW